MTSSRSTCRDTVVEAIARPARVRVCMFVNNPGLRDPRVTREAEVAVEAGFDVTVVACQNHDEDGPTRVLQRGVEFLRPKVGSSRLAGALRHVLGLRRTFSASPAAPREASPSADASATAAEKARPSLMRRLHGWGWGWRRTLVSLGQRIRLGLAVSADAYHAHDCDTLPIAWLCARLRGKPFIYDSHELWVDWKRMGGVGRVPVALWEMAERAFVRQAAACVTVSEDMAALLKRRHSLGCMLVVRNCPRRGTSEATVPRDVARRACGIENGQRIVLYQGGLWANRGLDVLVESARHVPEVDVLLVGRLNSYGAGLQQIRRDLGCRNVRFLGHRDEAERNALMAAADLGVVLTQDRSLSYRLTLSNKIFEYFANGLPVLASDLPPHRRIEAQTGACRLTNPEDAVILAEDIRRFFSMDETGRRRMGERARRAALDQLNMERQMTPLLELYRGVARIGR